MIDTPITPVQVAEARQLVATLRQREAHLADLQHQLRQAKTTNDRWNAYIDERLCYLSLQPERLAHLDRIYKKAPKLAKRRIYRLYRSCLRDMIDPVSLYGGPALKPRTVDFASLSIWARPYLIGPYLGIQQNNRFAEVHLRTIDPMERIVVVQTGGPVDINLWRSKLPDLHAWLTAGIWPGTWTITDHTANTLTLTRLSELPSVIPFDRTHLRKGALFVGIDTVQRTPVHIPFSELSAGTYIPGAAGSGKTSALHVLLRSIFANLDLFAAVYLIDGKDGVAMSRYSRLHPKVHVLYDEPDVWKLAADLTATMRDRNADQRARGVDKATSDFIAVIIDELPTFIAKPPKPHQADHATFIDNLQKIAMRGRSAGIRCFFISQSPVAEQIPVTLRTNCATTIAFRLPENAHATAVFGTLDGTNDPRKLRTGQAIVFQADAGKLTTVQFPFAPLYQPGALRVTQAT